MTLACALTAPRIWAEERHVVSPSELRQEIGTAAKSRRENIAALQKFLSSEPARKALASAHVDAERARQAVSLLSDAELARLNAQATRLQSDFAAGELTSMHITLIILGAILIAVIIVIVAAT